MVKHGDYSYVVTTTMKNYGYLTKATLLEEELRRRTLE